MRMPAFIMDEPAVALKHWKRVFSAVSVSSVLPLSPSAELQEAAFWSTSQKDLN